MTILKNILCTLLIMLIATSLLAQAKSSEFEIKPFARVDWYPPFTYRINTANYNRVKIRGESFGINAIYKQPFNSVYILIGPGFFRYSFNRIDQKNSLFPNTNNNRTINYTPPGPIVPAITYATDKYWYHAISLNTGVQKYFDLKKDWQMSAAINLINYFTIAQSYHIRDFKDKHHDFRYFGFSTALEFGITGKSNKINVEPILILPVYDLWKQDDVFPKDENIHESNSATRQKWFRGIGLGIRIKFPLKKN